MIKVLIVEDDPDTSLRIESIIHALGYHILPSVDNSEDALMAVENSNPDVLLLDIDIKGDLDGIQIAQAVKEKEIPIIFITGFEQEYFYNKAKKLQPVAYLIKPFNKLSLQAAIENAVISLSKNQFEEKDSSDWDEEVWLKDSFFIKRNNLLYKVNVDDIQYIQSEGNYCDIFTDKKYTTKISLSKLLEKLPKYKFIRIHQRYSIQAKLIENIDLYNNQVFVGGKGLPIGPKYREYLTKLADRL